MINLIGGDYMARNRNNVVQDLHEEIDEIMFKLSTFDDFHYDEKDTITKEDLRARLIILRRKLKYYNANAS